MSRIDLEVKETRQRSIYFTKENLDKIDDVRGMVPRSALINKMIEYLEVMQLKDLIR